MAPCLYSRRTFCAKELCAERAVHRELAVSQARGTQDAVASYIGELLMRVVHDYSSPCPEIDGQLASAPTDQRAHLMLCSSMIQPSLLQQLLLIRSPSLVAQPDR